VLRYRGLGGVAVARGGVRLLVNPDMAERTAVA